MGILDVFKKKKKEETIDSAPNLMAADPVSGGSVDLMANDPINTIQSAPVIEATPEIIEAPGIEEQMMQEAPSAAPEVPIAVSVEQATPQIESTTGVDAFDMPMPAAQTVAPEVVDSPAPEPVIQETVPEEEAPIPAPALEPVNSLSNKFCPECGTPNDALSKFCVSCGKPIE